eukprot:gene2585-biopygen6522
MGNTPDAFPPGQSARNAAVPALVWAQSHRTRHWGETGYWRWQGTGMAWEWRGPQPTVWHELHRQWREHGAGMARTCPVPPGAACRPRVQRTVRYLKNTGAWLRRAQRFSIDVKQGRRIRAVFLYARHASVFKTPGSITAPRPASRGRKFLFFSRCQAGPAESKSFP